MSKEFKNPVKLQTRCKVCGGLFETTVEQEDLDKFRDGTLVQTAFPYLTPDEREVFFLSHICSTCWDDMFKEDTKEEEY